MGCCVSTKSNTTTSPAPKTPQISTRQNGSSKSPPPTYEEETVKEVLSETPIIPRFHESASLKPDVFSRTAGEKKHHQNGNFFKKPFIAYGNDELSEVESEICSTHSESVSVSTALTDKMENKGDCNDDFRETQRRSPARFKKQPFSGEVKRENTVGRSPGRRSDPSPSRNRPGPCYGRRMDSGESSGRRSRSPVIRADSWSSKTGLDGCKSSWKMDKSPGRVGFGSGERIRKLEEETEGEENKWPPTSNELLENPHVSLECFIFL